MLKYLQFSKFLFHGQKRKKIYSPTHPFLMGYEPELDKTPALDQDRATYYQSIIGIMRWMCEIGRIDIATEVSLLSSHLAYPREGHLDAALHIMGCLKLKNNSRLIFVL